MKQLILAFALLCLVFNQLSAVERPKNEQVKTNQVTQIKNIVTDDLPVFKTSENVLNNNNQEKNSVIPNDIKGASPALYILAIFLPPVAVGIHTNWGKPTIFSLLWSICGFLPGIIHAFIVLGK